MAYTPLKPIKKTIKKQVSFEEMQKASPAWTKTGETKPAKKVKTKTQPR